MCGIYCYIGKKKSIPILIKGLKSLEYRGYDSAGIAYNINNKINIIKEEGKLENLEKLVDYDTDTYMGIAHTRWATHGKANKINAHPHRCGKITLVHNGIVENMDEIKKSLDYNFISETDTEVLTCLINNLYEKNSDMLKCLSELKNIVKGSYALGIIVDNDDYIYTIKKNSPLIIANSNIGNFIASDIPAILEYTNKYILLEDDEIAKISKEEIKIYDSDLNEIKKDSLIFNNSIETISKGNYEHFMLKEIMEQKNIIDNTIIPYLKNPFDISKYNKIHIVACGSAYHAGLIGKYLIEKYRNIEVNVEVASEYRYKKVFYDKNTLVIFISQSGETADTLACVKKVKKDNIDTLGIINVVSSSIAREVDNVIYTNVGCEIAVATTKAYSAQIAILMLLCMDNFDYKLPFDEVLNNNIYEKIADKIYNKEKVFFIGRGIDYAIALEGSLKLKEISYIHSEAYPAGELKHGTISLIDEDTVVIAISTDQSLKEKIISNIKEVESRKAKIIYITNDSDDLEYEKIVIPKVNEVLQPLITIIPLQLLAYYIAYKRNCDIDKPRNLAKSVTVE